MKLEPSLRSSSLMLTAATIIGIVLMAMSGLSYFKKVGTRSDGHAVSTANRQLQYRYSEFYPDPLIAKTGTPRDEHLSASSEHRDFATGASITQTASVSDTSTRAGSYTDSGTAAGLAALSQSSGTNDNSQATSLASANLQHHVTATWTTAPSTGSPNVSVPVTINVNNGDLFGELLQLHKRIEDLQVQQNRVTERHLATPKYQFFSYKISDTTEQPIQSPESVAFSSTAIPVAPETPVAPFHVSSAEKTTSRIQVRKQQSEQSVARVSDSNAVVDASTFDSQTVQSSSRRTAVVQASESQPSTQQPSTTEVSKSLALTKSPSVQTSSSSTADARDTETEIIFEKSSSSVQADSIAVDDEDFFVDEREVESEFGTIEAISYEFTSETEISSASSSPPVMDNALDFTEFERNEQFQGFEAIESPAAGRQIVSGEVSFVARADAPEFPEMAFEPVADESAVTSEFELRSPPRVAASIEREFDHAMAPSAAEPVDVSDFISLPSLAPFEVEQHTSPAPLEVAARRKVDATTFAKLAHLPPEDLFGDAADNTVIVSDGYDSLNTLNSFGTGFMVPEPLTPIPAIPESSLLATASNEKVSESEMRESVPAFPPVAEPESVTWQTLPELSPTPLRHISPSADAVAKGLPSASQSAMPLPNSDRVKRFEKAQQEKRAAALAKSRPSTSSPSKKTMPNSKLPQFTTFRRINKHVAKATSSFDIPSFDLPDPPDISRPDIDLPSPQLPEFKVPKLAMPDLPDPPDISLPDIDLPSPKLPEFKAPKLAMPDLPDPPDISRPDVDFPDFRRQNSQRPQSQAPGAKSPKLGLHAPSTTSPSKKPMELPKFSMPQFSFFKPHHAECDCCNQKADSINPISESPLVHRVMSTMQFAGHSKALK